MTLPEIKSRRAARVPAPAEIPNENNVTADRVTGQGQRVTVEELFRRKLIASWRAIVECILLEGVA
jgi:hypothetical protein